MARRGVRVWERPEVVADPQSLGAFVVRYLEWMEVHGLSRSTIKSRGYILEWFLRWCDTRAITGPGDVTPAMLERYQRHLFRQRTSTDGGDMPLSLETQYDRLAAVRGFFGWMAKQGYVRANPAAEMELPKVPERLPRQLLSATQVERVLRLPDVSTPKGLRDRAILETLYATGMRRLELRALKIYDMDLVKGTVMIRQGKGRKDRMVPMSPRACGWVDRYLHEARWRFQTETAMADDGTVFLARGGRPLSLVMLSKVTAEYVKAAGTVRDGACHLFRHTMATLMLEGGADTRYIQEMLGHKRLTTTQIYTKVSMRKLREVYLRTHPATGTQEPPRDAPPELEDGPEPTEPER